jgi:hypothetical protein
MRLPPRTVALSLLALLLGAFAAHGQSPIPTTPPHASPAPTASSRAKKSKLPRPKARHRPKTRRKVQVPAGDPPQKDPPQKDPPQKDPPQKDPPQKVVVRHGGTSEAQPQIAPVAPQNQDSAERHKAGQLLTATDTNLKSLLGQTLTPEQQATVAQARLFMGQARAALDAGDLTQGYNLASKANTLSEELVKK